MSHVAERYDVFHAEFERLGRDGAERQPEWARQVRLRALERFGELGFPTTRDEEWRFTPIGPIAETAFRLQPNLPGVDGILEGTTLDGALRAVVINGRFAAEHSALDALPAGLEIRALSEALEREPDIERFMGRAAAFDARPFVALNTAFLHDGVFIRVKPGTIVEKPIQVVFAAGGAGTMAHPRVLAVVGANAQVRIVESFVGDESGKYLTNVVSEFLVGDGALVDHYKEQHESDLGFHVGFTVARCARNSTFSSHAFSFGGAIVRNDAVAILDGEGVDCTLNGLYLSDGQRLVDNHTLIDHAQPHCGSHELYKGILAGKSRAVFNGKIIVRKDAQKTDAKQTNRALLLSDGAQINTKPQLEIFADDVKCTHGAAIGQLDDEAMFYLRARGLTAAQARDLLIHAFAGDILNRVRLEPLRNRLEAELFAALRRDGLAV